MRLGANGVCCCTRRRLERFEWLHTNVNMQFGLKCCQVMCATCGRFGVARARTHTFAPICCSTAKQRSFRKWEERRGLSSSQSLESSISWNICKSVWGESAVLWPVCTCCLLPFKHAVHEACSISQAFEAGQVLYRRLHNQRFCLPRKCERGHDFCSVCACILF